MIRKFENEVKNELLEEKTEKLKFMSLGQKVSKSLMQLFR